MRLQDVVAFSGDLYFEGAVQADWFYKQDKAVIVASNYVFHGPSTHAVTRSDVGGKALMDIANFVKQMVERLADHDESGNPFTMAIAGYGTGKSHLAVTLAQIFNGRDFNPEVFDRIMVNLAHADRACAENAKHAFQKPYLVLNP